MLANQDLLDIPPPYANVCPKVFAQRDILKLSKKILDEERFHLIGEKVYYVAQGILIEYPWCGYG